ncbi:MAG: PulJ/GspJ family protein, partial [Microbacterium sp.]
MSIAAALHRVMTRTAHARHDGRGSTLIEVLVGVVLLGIVMVPLSMATIVAWRTVFGIQQKLSSSADAQLLAATFPEDVQSAGATGVNPTDPVNADTCAVRAEDGETSLIMFVWDEDLGVSNQSVARYLAQGSGAESRIIRRFCKGNAAPQDTVVARNFGIAGIKEASLFTVGANGAPTPQCSATSCFIKITGEYSFQLDV